MQVKTSIWNFKSIKKLEFSLGDLTILIGPPSTGKSNILEALEVAGYLSKVLIEKNLGEYSDIANQVGALNQYVRGAACRDLMNKSQAEAEARITLGNTSVTVSCTDNPYRVNLAYMTGGSLVGRVETMLIREGEYSLLLPGIEDDALQFLSSLLHGILSLKSRTDIVRVAEENPENMPRDRLLVPRLYGFDRMRAIENISHGRTGSYHPVSYMEEKAVNLGRLLYVREDILDYINEDLEELARVRVTPLSDGKLAFFDGDKEVGPASISDTVLRVLYGYTALLSNRPSDKDLKGVDLPVNPIVMLEEPESHMYPAAFHNFVDIVGESIVNNTLVIVTTHSGRLAQLLWDRIVSNEGKDILVYYVNRENGVETVLYEVNMREIVRRLDDLEDILRQPPDIIDDLVQDGILRKIAPR
ncbi:MAG: AAA family ATPase [Desulfurococcales archaeon]|nr:AAA family ATPase [Desulfurococcales archaeon]